MNYSVEHIGLPARNPRTLSDWYVAVLGAELIAPNGGEPPYFLRPPGSAATFEIYAATGHNGVTEDNGLAGWRHMALRVESIEAARKLLESRGAKFIDPVKPAAGGGNILFFKDAEGNLLHLVERPPGSMFS